MSEQTIEQKLQSEIVLLKSRILDTQDAVAQAQQESRILQEALGKICHAVGIEGEQIKIDDIIDAVNALVPEASDEE